MTNFLRVGVIKSYAFNYFTFLLEVHVFFSRVASWHWLQNTIWYSECCCRCNETVPYSQIDLTRWSCFATRPGWETIAVSSASSALTHGCRSRGGKQRIACNRCLITGRNVIKWTETRAPRWKRPLVLFAWLFVCSSLGVQSWVFLNVKNLKSVQEPLYSIKHNILGKCGLVLLSVVC